MIDPGQLGAMIRERRKKHGWSLRRAAEETDVSFNTLARVEAGNQPDLETYFRLLRWMGIEPQAAAPDISTVEAIAGHLSRDPSLSEENAQRIGTVLNELYRALASPPQASAVHLRTATTFNPAAARLLGELLEKMHDALESGGAAA